MSIFDNRYWSNADGGFVEFDGVTAPCLFQTSNKHDENNKRLHRVRMIFIVQSLHNWEISPIMQSFFDEFRNQEFVAITCDIDDAKFWGMYRKNHIIDLPIDDNFVYLVKSQLREIILLKNGRGLDVLTKPVAIDGLSTAHPEPYLTYWGKRVLLSPDKITN